ncbi:MAG TPA: hypothetical protein VF258_07150 [Luteolibacter sp.]
MTQRFQIEDLVTQDISGVVFHALDTKTNRPVELRRFFPFGATAEGLRENEQITYTTMVEHLSLINHPSLRAIIGGGCDPIDGMPFLATEWIEGTTLQTVLGQQPYPIEDATILLRQALEVCELLSQALDEEAVWVETNLEDILIGAEGSGREITFAFAPLKWLGPDHARRGLEGIATLCENLIIWNGKSVAGHAGQGLDGWLKWLRGAAMTTTLREAREKLPAPIRAKSPVRTPTHKPVAKRAVIRKTRKTSNLAFFLSATLALAAIATGGWALIRYNNSKNAALVAEAQEDQEDLETLPIEPPPAAEPVTVEGPPPQKAGESNSDIIFTPADHDLLIAQKSQPAILEGVLEAISHSKTGKSMYLSFSKTPSHNEPRGRILLKSAPDGLSEISLTPLIGKKIQLRGTVQVEVGNPERPLIVIKSRNAIKEVK